MRASVKYIHRQGEEESDQKRTSIALVTSLFYYNAYKGGAGVKYLAYLSVHTLWMAPM